MSFTKRLNVVFVHDNNHFLKKFENFSFFMTSVVYCCFVAMLYLDLYAAFPLITGARFAGLFMSQRMFLILEIAPTVFLESQGRGRRRDGRCSFHRPSLSGQCIFRNAPTLSWN